MAAELAYTYPDAAVLVRTVGPQGPFEWRFPSVKVRFRPDIEDGVSFSDGVCSFKDADRLVGLTIDGYAKAAEGGAVGGWMLRPNVDDAVVRLAAAVDARRPVEAWRAARALVKDGRSMLRARKAMIL